MGFYKSKRKSMGSKQYVCPKCKKVSSFWLADVGLGYGCFRAECPRCKWYWFTQPTKPMIVHQNKRRGEAYV